MKTLDVNYAVGSKIEVQPLFSWLIDERKWISNYFDRWLIVSIGFQAKMPNTAWFKLLKDLQLFFVKDDWELNLFGFGPSLRQIKQSEDMTLGCMKLWWLTSIWRTLLKRKPSLPEFRLISVHCGWRVCCTVSLFYDVLWHMNRCIVWCPRKSTCYTAESRTDQQP